MIHRRHRSLFTHALLVSLIPEISTEAYMAFGSTALFDAHFNIAHGLKIIAYLVPLTGLMMEYERAYREKQLFAKQLDARVAELNRVNEEMEQFVYTVSHDLKSPLVTIQGYVGFLRQDLDQQRFDRFVQFTDRISDGVDRMRSTIDDLLELSRIGRVVNPTEMINTGELVSQLIDQMATQINEVGVEVTVQPYMPFVHADRVRLEQALQNLISDAVKYGQPDHGDRRITIGGGIAGGEVRLFVADNGPGIAEAFQEKIFGLFERLQTGEEGTGIGLAIVKRAAIVHGGRAWVESTPGEGATFFFAIPVNTAANLLPQAV